MNNYVNNTLITLTTALGIAVASPALAHDTQQAPAQAQQETQNEAMKGRRAVIGEVIDTREIQLKGVKTKHRLVKIRNDQGKTLIVDVGDATRTPAGRFKKGSTIVAVGKEARINGDPVLYARYVGDLREVGSVGAVAKR